MRRLLLLLLLPALLRAAGPLRVVSQTVGTDELLVALADPGQIAALSNLARDPAFRVTVADVSETALGRLAARDIGVQTRDLARPGQVREAVQGADLVPWCPSRILDAAEADHLLHGRPVPLGALQEPAWAMPEGFPDPGAPVRGLLDGRLVALLREKDGGLWTAANLRGGI